MSEQSLQIAKRRSVRLKLGLILILILMLGGTWGAYLFWTENLSPVSTDLTAGQVKVVIPKGASASEIGRILGEQQLIRSPKFFSLYARYTKQDSSFRSGEYLLSPSQDLNTIMATLSKDPPRFFTRVTIPEGYNTKQIADLLEKDNLINRDKFFQLVREGQFNYDFLKGIKASDLRLEGFLFPATYEIDKGSTEQQIIEMMLKRFQQELTPEINEAVKQKGWTVKQFITMASLIEKEARKQEDRPIISEVFQKRLKIGMPLQSCASIQFLLGYPKLQLTYADLEIKSPYNTYQNKGLPPGPIANPGQASIRAAAFPAATDYLYFVAKPDGYHAFAKTYNEHLSNINKYQK